jgi:hypothetical protein
MRTRTLVAAGLILALCLAIGTADAINEAFEEERRQVTLASRRPARQLKPRTASRLVLASTAREPRIAPAQAPVPDGWLLCWRRHANGQLAAIIGHADGTMTARLWPAVDRFSTGIRTMATAQQAADTLAHADAACEGCKPWTYS